MTMQCEGPSRYPGDALMSLFRLKVLPNILSKRFNSVSAVTKGKQGEEDVVNKTQTLLTKISDQYPLIYAKVNIFNFPFTISRQDQIVMHRLKDVQVGDVIKLNQIREIGSKDFTIKGNPWIDTKFCDIEACVVEHGRGAKVQAKEPKKRKGHQRNVTIKPLTTTLLIRDIKINTQP
jgi:ribosomal protein L21